MEWKHAKHEHEPEKNPPKTLTTKSSRTMTQGKLTT